MDEDIPRSELIDLRGLSLSDVRDKIDRTTIRTALDMILLDQDHASNNGFNQYI
jgi:hypothetical protein